MKTKILFTLLALLSLTASVRAEYHLYSGFTTYYNYSGNECEAKLVDGDYGTKWYCSGTWNPEVKFSYKEAIKITGYRLTTGNDNATNTGRNPLNWVLSRFNSSWQNLGSIAEVSGCTVLEDKNSEHYSFYISSPDQSVFSNYSFKLSGYQDDKQLGELELFYCDHKVGTTAEMNLEHFDGTPGDCVTDGVIEYWQCKDCGQLFTDANAVNATADTIAHHETLAHGTLTHHDAVNPQCETPGCEEYWTCNVCNKDFSDANTTSEITDLSSIAIKPLYLKQIAVEKHDSYSSYYGFMPYYQYCASQNLYLKDEIGRGGVIESIAFYCASTISGESLERDIKVYMCEVDAETLSQNIDNVSTATPVSVSGLTPVFNGSVTVGQQEGWDVIQLTTPFNYSGNKNLAVIVYCASAEMRYNIHYSYQYDSDHAISRGSDTSSYASESSSDEYFASSRSDIRFTFTTSGHTCADLTTITGFCNCDRCHFDYEPTNMTTVTLTDGSAYTRTTAGKVTDALTYSRTFTAAEVGHWQPLYMPISYQYQDTDEDDFEIAEIYTYGVAGDSNGDGVVNALDGKKMLIQKLESPCIIVANAPYLIRPKAAGTITFASYDGKLAAAVADSVDCGTMRETFTFTGTYSNKVAAAGEAFYVLANDRLSTTSSAIAPYRWYMTTNTTFASGIDLYEMEPEKLHYDSYTFVDKQAYTNNATVSVDQLTYQRTFGDTGYNCLYVPFTMQYSDWCEKADVYKLLNIFEYDNDDNGTIDTWSLRIVKLGEGSVAKANTPYIIRPKSTGSFEITVSNTELKPVASKSIWCASTDYKFVFTGTCAKTSIQADTYFFISDDDKLKYSDQTVSLNTQRWYMGIYDKEDDTLIRPSTFNTTSQNAPSRGYIQIVEDNPIANDIQCVEHDRRQEYGVSYDLQGRRVNNPGRGLYLINGKKVIIR